MSENPISKIKCIDFLSFFIPVLHVFPFKFVCLSGPDIEFQCEFKLVFVFFFSGRKYKNDFQVLLSNVKSKRNRLFPDNGISVVLCAVHT